MVADWRIDGGLAESATLHNPRAATVLCSAGYRETGKDLIGLRRPGYAREAQFHRPLLVWRWFDVRVSELTG